jgi:hypothetical protein
MIFFAHDIAANRRAGLDFLRAILLTSRRNFARNKCRRRRVIAIDYHHFRRRLMTLDKVMTKPHSLIASDRIEGTEVRRPNGDRIGHIERLMIDKISGKVSYAILSFGGFLGIGANLVPLPWARMTFSRKLDAYQLDISDEELRRAPSFVDNADFDWGDRALEEDVHRYYGVPPYWGGF